MKEPDVFVSVGGTSNEQQEAFVRSVEDRLRSEGLIPHTVGRNTFSSDAPLKTVTDLMEKCSGTVVIALERTYFATGIEKRGGPKESALNDVRLPTPWNQIEAAMSYAHGLPLMVIVEAGLKSEGLLERGNDWYVQWVKPETSALNSNEFNGVLASWKQKMADTPKNISQPKDFSDFTVAELLGGLKPVQLWSVLAALAALVAGAFALGGKLFGGP
ncbi:MAG: hypothetical protein ABIK92_09760 [Pseudomonadota bacterium]